jgi:DUF2934 family protein
VDGCFPTSRGQRTRKLSRVELYLVRGGDHGHHLDDWLQAERELRDAARSTGSVRELTTSLRQRGQG